VARTAGPDAVGKDDGLIERGLDLLNFDETRDEEAQAFRDWYADRMGYALPAFEFWLENDPSVLKRYRLHAYLSNSSIMSALGMLHFYSIYSYPDGILYEIRNAQKFGASKAQILETLAVAFIHHGPRGARYVATSSSDYMRTFEPVGVAPVFPDGWGPDHAAFEAGLDFSTVELSPREGDLLIEWYRRTLGEVPDYIPFYIKHRPLVLKQMRNRFENSIVDALPKQMMPWLQLQWNAGRGHEDGIWENALLGRAWGISEADLVDAVVWGVNYGGGTAGANVAARVLTKIFPEV
jgi:hypothetical protein